MEHVRRPFLQRRKLRPLLVMLLFWIVMAASRTALLRLFPAGGDAGDIAVSLVATLLIAASFLFTLLVGDDLPKNFLLIALLVGVFYVVVTKFAFCTDEEYHFQRAFSITNGDFMPVLVNGEPGVYVPHGYYFFADHEHWSLANYFQNADLVAPVRVLEYYARSRSTSYLPLCYLPSALGLGLGRLLGLPVALMLVLGRLTNYLTYVFVCYLAIRRVKKFQSVLFLTALIPTCLELAGTLTLDSTLAACCLLFLSICLHYTFDETSGRISPRDVALLSVSALFLLSAKYLGYFAVVLLVLFIPKKRADNKRAAVLAVGGAFVLAAALQAWAVLSYIRYDSGATSTGADMYGQLRFVLGHPAAFIKTLALDFMSNFVNRLHFFIDTGSMSLNFLAQPLALLPIAGAILAKDKPSLTARQSGGWSILWVALGSITILLCTAALYFSFTPVGASMVNGMQNRYALPVVALMYLPMSLIPVENRIPRWERTLSLLAGLALVNILAGKLVELLAL